MTCIGVGGRADEAAEGIRVLDLTNVLAGPFCCYQLAALGADVIKVEVPGTGDLARELGADPALNRKLMGTSFLAQNAGKRSITLNLKSQAGKDLSAPCRHGAGGGREFRPGVMRRPGLGYAALKDANPGLVYCAISGRSDGLLKDNPAYDQIVQGLSGSERNRHKDGSPLRVGYPIADTIGGQPRCRAAASFAARGGGGIDGMEATLVTKGWQVQLSIGGEPQREQRQYDRQPRARLDRDGLLNIAANRQSN